MHDEVRVCAVDSSEGLTQHVTGMLACRLCGAQAAEGGGEGKKVSNK